MISNDSFHPVDEVHAHFTGFKLLQSQNEVMGQTHHSWPLPPAAGKRAGLNAFSHSLITKLEISIQNLITIIFIYKQSVRLRGNHACFSNSPSSVRCLCLVTSFFSATQSLWIELNVIEIHFVFAQHTQSFEIHCLLFTKRS